MTTKPYESRKEVDDNTKNRIESLEHSLRELQRWGAPGKPESACWCTRSAQNHSSACRIANYAMNWEKNQTHEHPNPIPKKDRLSDEEINALLKRPKPEVLADAEIDEMEKAPQRESMHRAIATIRKLQEGITTRAQEHKQIMQELKHIKTQLSKMVV